MIEVADRAHLAVDGAGPGVLTTFAVVLGVGALLGIALYVWYALALSKLFTRLGVEGWKGWVPILNEVTILTLGGKPAWNVVFYFIPIVQIYGLVVKIQAVHSINGRFGRGAGSTVLAVLLPPVWASILAWGVPPYPEGDRLAALQPGPRRQGQPATDAAPHDSSKGYLAPPILPPGAASAHGEPASFTPGAPAHQPAAFSDPATAGARPVAPPPAFAPPPPTFAPAPPTFAPGPAAATPASVFPEAPAPTPAETAPPAYPDAAEATPASAPTSMIVDVPGIARTAPVPPSGLPSAPPSSTLPSAPPSFPAATEARDLEETRAPADEASDPVLETLPQPPTRASLAAEQAHASTRRAGSDDPQVSVGSFPDRLGAAPESTPEPEARSPRFTVPAPVPVVLPMPEPARPSPQQAEATPPVDVDQTLSTTPPTWSAPVADTIDPPAPAPAPVPVPAPAPTPAPQPVSPAPQPVSPAEPEPLSPAAIRPAPIVFTPPLTQPSPSPVDPTVPTVESDDDDDDFEATVVVSRRRGVRRVLVLDDGRSFALSATSVVIGRNPTGEPGEQRLAIADSTRTLSKTHARLIVQADEWRLTDLHSTNGVVVVADDGAETLLDPGESVIGAGRFVLGEVGMHVEVGTDS